MKSKPWKLAGQILGAFVLVGGIFGVGVYVGFSYGPSVDKVVSVTNKGTPAAIAATSDFGPFWRAWNILNEKSIYSEKVSDQDKIWGAIQGLAASFNDPYTVFMPPEESKMFNDDIHGSFGGIGAEIDIKDKLLTIVSPLKGTPAEKAGLQAGDQILKINNTETFGMTTTAAIGLIRGEKGTPVDLIILRSGEKEPRKITVVRDIIDIPTIETKLRSDGIFVISFYTFSENSIDLFQGALQEFIKSKSNKLVIDLRGNPGGYLDASIAISSWFIDQGKTVVIEDFGESQKQNIYRSKGPRLFSDKLKLVVLVDGGSASASEIVAGALQENGIATLVGQTTFGKGSVQELIKLTEDTSLKVTVAKWLTPNGISLSSGGLKPDVVVPFSREDFDAGRDPQMDKAVEILNRK